MINLPVLANITFASEAEQQSQFATPIMVANTSFLNVRTGPGAQFTVLVTVVGGTEMPVLARGSDDVWFQVSTVAGVGWVNVEFVIPRGNFDNLPIVDVNDFFRDVPVQTTVGLPPSNGQGGGGAPTSSVAPTTSTSPSTGGRFRAVINVAAVDLRSTPVDGSTVIGTVFRDDEKDYAIVGGTSDGSWLQIVVPDIGTGWVEAPKILFRLNASFGTVVIVTTETAGLTRSPGGGGDGLPILTGGTEAFLRDIRNMEGGGSFVLVELADGTTGWLPFDSVRTRTGTSTDGLPVTGDTTASTFGGTTSAASGGTSPPVPPAPVGPALEVPHVVVNTSFLNVRSGAGAQFATVATLRGGTELPVVGIARDGVWFLVEGDFGRGWVNNDFTIFRGNIDNVPIIQDTTGALATPVAVISVPIQLFATPTTAFGSIGTVNPSEAPIVARTADFAFVQLSTPIGFGWTPATSITIRGDADLIPIVG